MMTPIWLDLLWGARAAVPVLPDTRLMAVWQSAGWSVVLACVVLAVARRWQVGARAQWAIIAATAAAVSMPSSLGLGYWLGMSFQSPSVVAVVLCSGRLYRNFASKSPTSSLSAPSSGPVGWILPALGVILGWGMLLDTLGLLPVPLYQWGFHAAAPLAVLALMGVLWALEPKPVAGVCGAGLAGLVAMAVVAFSATRLPTGNLWDAVLDPWLWIALHIVGAQKLMRR